MPAGTRRTALARLVRRPAALVGLVLLALLVLAALAAPLVAPHRDAIRLEERCAPPSRAHPFGTDDLGRDTLARTLHAGRVSLAVAAAATLVAVGLGTLLGLVAGFHGGRIDAAVVHVVDLALAIPTFFLLLLLGSWWGQRMDALCLVIGLTGWMPVTRLVRSAVLGLRHRTYVEAARALGFGTPRIVLRHVLPGTAAPVLVAAALVAAQAVLLESALGYLGFGMQPPTPSWGAMLRESQAHLFDAPWTAVFPGAELFLTVLALHLLGDAFRDALDPRLGT